MSSDPKTVLLETRGAMVATVDVILKACKANDLQAIHDGLEKFLNKLCEYNLAIKKMNAQLVSITNANTPQLEKHIENNKAFFERLPEQLTQQTQQFINANQEEKMRLKDNLQNQFNEIKGKLAPEDETPQRSRPGRS